MRFITVGFYVSVSRRALTEGERKWRRTDAPAVERLADDDADAADARPVRTGDALAGRLAKRRQRGRSSAPGNVRWTPASSVHHRQRFPSFGVQKKEQKQKEEKIESVTLTADRKNS